MERRILTDIEANFSAGDGLWNLSVGQAGATQISSPDGTVLLSDYSPATAIANLFGQSEARRVISELTTRNMTVDSIETLGRVPDLSEILDAIHNETDSLLQPSLEAMEDSFARRNAVVLRDGERVVGYVRFTELLNDDVRKKLGLRDDFPEIYESGTAIILSELRGRHLYPRMRNGLLSLRADDIRNKRLLGLGTSRKERVIRSGLHSSEVGIGFEVVDYSSIPMITPFTCGCDGDFGSGFQNGPSCFNRATSSEVILIQQLDFRALQEQTGKPAGKIPCTLYVSDLELAQQMNTELMGIFGSQEALIEARRVAGL